MKAFVSILSAISVSCHGRDPLLRHPGNTIHPLSPLLHPRSAPFNQSAISTERLRRYVRRHHGFQSPQRGSVVWYSSGQRKTFVTLFTAIQTPLHPSDGRSFLEKAKRTFVFPQPSLLGSSALDRGETHL